MVKLIKLNIIFIEDRSENYAAIIGNNGTFIGGVPDTDVHHSRRFPLECLALCWKGDWINAAAKFLQFIIRRPMVICSSHNAVS